MKRINSILTKGAFLLLLALGRPQANAYTHPSIPFTADDLATIKANLDKQPWKRGYELFVADRYSQLTYKMQGPFETVTRNPDLNRWVWMSDMEAVYNLAMMWYFTGNSAYAKKSHDILLAWATTQTSMGGQESGLMLGDFAYCYAGGADILRTTWPGWTAADTTTVKNYFLNVLWPGTSAGTDVPGEASKGLLNLQAGIAIAVFCDDTAKFNHVINQYRTYPGAGLVNTLPTGETGEAGRDAGHLFDCILGMAFISEVAWKQGIDLYSELDNRLLPCGEYYARNTSIALDNPFVPYGTVDYTYYANAAGPYTANRSGLYLIQNAYKNRFGLPTPWIDRKLQEQNLDTHNFMYAKTADSTTATPLAASVRPEVSLASSGLTLTTLGNNSAGSSSSYANGVWTLSGLGNGVWRSAGDSDDCQFAYKQMTGDCAMVAKVTSFTNSGTQAGKAGLMLRDNLSATVSKRGFVDVSWDSSGTNSAECRQDGWKDNWGGIYFSQRSNPLPPGLPYWIKIERTGNQITGYTSPDGTSWAPLVSPYYANLPSTVYIGLFICSGNTTPVTATFANVAFTGGSGGLVTTPAAPAAVFADASDKAITVRWLSSFGATAYDLLRSTASGSGYTVIASDLTAAKTSYVDTTAAADTTYYYVVRAKNSAGTSGNSPQFYGSLLPAPMVNLAFSGTSTAIINTGTQVGGSDTAFDGDPGSKWYCWNSPTGWLQYDFGKGKAQIVKRYTINCADVADRDPKNWNFLGSQDGSTWTTLDSRSNQSFGIRMGMNTYDIGNTTAYRYYRLDITANNGASGVAVAELGLWGGSGHSAVHAVLRGGSDISEPGLRGDSGHTILDGTYGVVIRRFLSNMKFDPLLGVLLLAVGALVWRLFMSSPDPRSGRAAGRHAAASQSHSASKNRTGPSEPKHRPQYPADDTGPKLTVQVPGEGALERRCLQLAERDPRAAVILAIDSLAYDTHPGLLENLVGQWATHDFQASHEWALQQQPSDWRDGLMARIAFAGSQSDPVAAASIVAEEMTPGPRQTEAAISVLQQWALRDLNAATAWALAFPEGALRERAKDEIDGIRKLRLNGNYSET